MDKNDINSQVWHEALSADKGCLSLEVLQNVAEGVSDADSLQHLDQCPHCQAELAMLKNFESSLPSQEEGASVAWIAAELERRERRAPAAPAGPRVPFWRNFLRIPYMSGAVALALVVGLSISLYVSNREPRTFNVNIPGTETMRSGSVRLEGPSGDLDRLPDYFRWEAYPGTKKYRVEVVEVDGTPLWSKESTQNFVTSSAELKKKMLPGKTLLWRVTAIDDSGKARATSSQERFQIKIKDGR